ncbi:hypothetical protein HD554DRAFT_2037696 [Boletus coccyginus]|nr:hypothetical protein HD554DRAFT_2037696 [Boletus coccyginus]
MSYLSTRNQHPIEKVVKSKSKHSHRSTHISELEPLKIKEIEDDNDVLDIEEVIVSSKCASIANLFGSEGEMNMEGAGENKVYDHVFHSSVNNPYMRLWNERSDVEAHHHISIPEITILKKRVADDILTIFLDHIIVKFHLPDGMVETLKGCWYNECNEEWKVKYCKKLGIQEHYYAVLRSLIQECQMKSPGKGGQLEL